MKTQTTLDLEREIFNATSKQGVFGCFEVTIGWFGTERVDYMTYDTNGIFRCYEIKQSKADFFSKAKKSFVGHYNYYVLPYELYKQVERYIPSHIGVYVEGGNVKRAKKQIPKADEKVLKDSLIRSLSREVDKQIRSCDEHLISRLRQEIKAQERRALASEKQFQELLKEIKCPECYGRGKIRSFTDNHKPKSKPCASCNGTGYRNLQLFHRPIEAKGKQGWWNSPEPICSKCGCSWYNACSNGCYWVEEDLCSNCVDEK